MTTSQIPPSLWIHVVMSEDHAFLLDEFWGGKCKSCTANTFTSVLPTCQPINVWMGGSGWKFLWVLVFCFSSGILNSKSHPFTVPNQFWLSPPLMTTESQQHVIGIHIRWITTREWSLEYFWSGERHKILLKNNNLFQLHLWLFSFNAFPILCCASGAIFFSVNLWAPASQASYRVSQCHIINENWVKVNSRTHFGRFGGIQNEKPSFEELFSMSEVQEFPTAVLKILVQQPQMFLLMVIIYLC